MSAYVTLAVTLYFSPTSPSIIHTLHFLCLTPAIMSMEESISLEETNKIRIGLGLKPLTDDKEPALDADKAAEDNYAKLREKEAKERETKYAF